MHSFTRLGARRIWLSTISSCCSPASRPLSTILAPFSLNYSTLPYYHHPDGLHSILSENLRQMKDAGTYKVERVITSPQQPQVAVMNPTTHQDSLFPSPTADANAAPQKVLNFCANNYLGLANHPRLLCAARDALDSHGFGCASVRFICGTTDLHVALEKEIARFHGFEDAILYASCFDANAAIFETVLTKNDVVVSDELNHASIIDGIRLCKAERLKYKHADLLSLEEQLRQAKILNPKNILIATDGVFSMDGTIAPLQGICDLAEKYSAIVFVDDCHATGFLGDRGTGTAEFCNVQNRVDIVNTTLGKALGGASGGYTVARKEIVHTLRQKARPYLFSNSIPPMLAAAGLEVFEILESEEGNKLRNQLQQNTMQFRTEMTNAGFNIPQGTHPIVPIMLGEAKLAVSYADEMLKQGIYVIGFCYPVVPKGKARIRVQLSAAHTKQEIDRTVDAFRTVGKKLGVI